MDKISEIKAEINRIIEDLDNVPTKVTATTVELKLKDSYEINDETKALIKKVVTEYKQANNKIKLSTNDINVVIKRCIERYIKELLSFYSDKLSKGGPCFSDFESFMKQIRAKQESLAAEYKTAYNDLVKKLRKMLEKEIKNTNDDGLIKEFQSCENDDIKICNFINKFFVFNLQSDGQYKSFTLQIDVRPKLKADDKGIKLKVEVDIYCKIADHNSGDHNANLSNNKPLPNDLIEQTQNILKNNFNDLFKVSRQTNCDFLQIRQRLYRFGHKYYERYQKDCLDLVKPEISVRISGQK
jgi:hypothetical protein